MTIPQQVTVTVQGAQIKRAAQLAQAITADPETTRAGDREWTVQDVINVALARGMDALEQMYVKGGRSC